MRHIGVLTLTLIATSCSTTSADLEAKSPAVVQNFTENYQEIYRRTSTTAKRCIAGNMGAYASMAVDSDLFSEPGYGEITVSLINMGVRNYYLTARIERLPSGSRMTVRSGNTLASEANLNSVLRWASGDQECFGTA